MKTPRLSICIATFNRAAFIGETLESLLPQVTDEVEIVVLDGASTDDTREVMRSYERSCPRLRYVRGTDNGGVDRDFDRVVQLALGDYCWLMTDDDLLHPGAVATVLQALEQDPSLVIVNAEVRDATLSKVVERSRLTFDERRTYGPQELSRLFADVGAYVSFIGCVVIKRSVWLAREREPYFGTLFIHVGVIFQHSLPGNAVVLPERLISIRYGNAMWRPREFEIWMFKWPSLVWSLPELSEQARNAVYPAEPWKDLKRLFFFRAKGTYSLEDYRRWIQPRAGSRRAALAAQAVAAFPGPLANLLALLYLSVPVAGRETGRWLADAKSSRFYVRNWLKRPGPS